MGGGSNCRGHFAQFYPDEKKLVRSLSKYIEAGIEVGDTCIVIATKKHIDSLNSKMMSDGTNIVDAQFSKRYMTLNASEALNTFMKDGMPSWPLFHGVIGPYFKKAALNNSKVRLYGEVVALLWKAGNIDAVIKLERYWNELALIYPFSLYCAYPELHFVMNRQELEKIKEEHSHCFRKNYLTPA